MDFLESITLKDLTYTIVGVITVISIVVEKATSLPCNPWTKIFDWLGSHLMHEMAEKLENIERQQEANNLAINELNKKMVRKFDEKQKSDDEKEVKRLRENIISFADSCRVGNRHTQNHFENIFRDYSDYNDYCRKHNFANHFIDEEYSYISEIYQECLKDNKFI